MSSGQTASVEITLAAADTKKAPTPPPPTAESPFERPDQIEKVGEWYKNNGIAPYTFLATGAPHNFELTFLAPGKNVFGKQKKVEWVIAYASEQQKLAYEFDGKKLTRKASFGDKPETSSVTCKVEGTAIQFVVSVEAGKVDVRSPSCEHPDTYESPKIGI